MIKPAQVSQVILNTQYTMLKVPLVKVNNRNSRTETCLQAAYLVKAWTIFGMSIFNYSYIILWAKVLEKKTSHNKTNVKLIATL